MTVSVRDVREAIATALTAIDGLNTSPLMTDTVITPQAMVRLTEVDYRETFGNSSASYPMAILVFTGRADEEGGQDFLDELALPFGDNSIRQLLEDNDGGNLGGLVDYVCVDSVGDLEVRVSLSDPNVQYLAREWELRVVATNS